MILCMTTDDTGILNDAYKGYDQSVFGIPYCYLAGHSFGGMLGRGENLFISAHGDDTEIGNETGQPAYTAAQLKAALTNNILPGNYTGKLYISACGSAPLYVNTLRTALGAAYAGRVFGMFGDIDYAIEAPTSNAWQAAT